jgi:nitrogen regulatory protein PII
MNEKESLPSSSSLPYEVRGEEGGGKNANKYNNITTKKKKVEAIIPSEKTDSVLSMLQSMNIQATFYESKGIDENKVGEVINAIRQSAKTESKSNVGIIVISSVDNILTI